MITVSEGAHQVIWLLEAYDFELLRGSPADYVNAWAGTYSTVWIHNAVVEALYQGRYKIVSVDQILKFWARRGLPLCHFPPEFRRMIFPPKTSNHKFANTQEDTFPVSEPSVPETPMHSNQEKTFESPALPIFQAMQGGIDDIDSSSDLVLPYTVDQPIPPFRPWLGRSNMLHNE